MPYDLVVAPEAELDIEEACVWHEGRRIGLGEEFVSGVSGCVYVSNERRQVKGDRDAARISRLGEACGVENRDIAIAGEILHVEGENFVDPVHVHRGDEAGVVGVLTRNLMQFDKAFPLVKQSHFRKQGPEVLIWFISLAVCSMVRPSPLSAKGRVATAHSSIRF